MNMKLSRKVGAATLVAALLAPFAANAESNVVTGAGALTATSHVDFTIVIPKFVSLRVGAAGAPIDMITFTVPGSNVGDGSIIAGTGGVPGPGAVTATVTGNGGTVTLGASTVAALTNLGGNTISWGQVATATSNPLLAAPVLTNGASAGVSVAPTLGVVNQTATWTYTYTNSLVPAAGTYGGSVANNGRVTYTASVL
jgi:hypothetical protein